MSPKLNRVIEWHDGCDHAQRLADRHSKMAIIPPYCIHGHHPAKNPLGLFGEAPKDIGCDGYFGPGLQDWLPIFLRQEPA